MMISVEELAAVVGRIVILKRVGPQRWQGLCPFHNEKSPSFQIWKGRRGEGRYHCHGCGEDGDAIDWMRKIEGKSYRDAGGHVVDQEIHKQQIEQNRRERLLQQWRDNSLDSPIPDWFILAHPELIER